MGDPTAIINNVTTKKRALFGLMVFVGPCNAFADEQDGRGWTTRYSLSTRKDKVTHDISNIVNRFGILYHIDKTAVLQEARVFNDTPINPRKCRVLLTKIIYLLYLGEPFNTKEATDLFFNVIKLFQSKDVS